MFPTLTRVATIRPHIVETRPGARRLRGGGVHAGPDALARPLPLDRIALIVDVWADRYVELGARADVEYVFPFENRGVEVGVTLHHPHGQIYAYPFVPPVAARELAQQRAYLDAARTRAARGSARARNRGRRARVLYRGEQVVALVPVCARYPYEVWIAPRRAAPSLDALTPAERRDFARALKTVLLKYDGLWQRPFPYIMAFHQAPTDGQPHPEAHVHVEFYPAYRMPNRLKYLAGSEIGAGVFTADTLPEEAAAELRAVEVRMLTSRGARRREFTALFGRDAGRRGEASGPREPDRRAHRLQRRLRAADGDSAAHARRRRAARRSAGARLERELGAGAPSTFDLGDEAPRPWLDRLRPGRDPGARARRRHASADSISRFDRPCRSAADCRRARRWRWQCCARLRDLFALTLDDVTIARLGQRAENEFVGAPVGIMDQMASSLARPGVALFIDTRSLAYEQVRAAGRHGAGRDQLRRRAQPRGGRLPDAARRVRARCRAARRAGAARRRRRGAGSACALPEPIDRRGAARRDREPARARRRGRDATPATPRALGRLFSASHASQRDDYEVSVPEVDLLVDAGQAEPAVLGARLTGGGFGGSIVALVRRGEAAGVATRVAAEYRSASIASPPC